MKTKSILIATAVLFTGFASKAQSINEAIKLTQSERYEDASQAFAKAVTQEGGNAYFFYADNFLRWGELDSARIVLNKGLTAQPSNPLIHVGVAKLALLENKNDLATSSFAKANELVKAAGKSITKVEQALVLTKQAEAYIAPENKNPETAIALLLEAEKLNAKDPEIYIVLGDANFAKNMTDASEAIRNYDKAYELDKTSRRAILKIGELYTKVGNFEEGLNQYNKAIELDPNFAPAYSARAELYYRAGKVKLGVQDYKKYLELNNSPSARGRYASFLYVAKDFETAIIELKNVIGQGGNVNPILYRILGYSYYETKAYTEGLQNLDKFLAIAKKDGKPKLISLDYSYHGRLLAETGQDSLGINEILKAIELDPTFIDGYGDIAGIYFKQKNYAKAAEYYGLKVSKTEAPDYLDYSRLASALYSNAQYKEADEAYAKVVEAIPNSTFGYIWRGRSQNRMDNAEQPTLAKPFYETVLTIGLKDPERNKRDLIEAYSYLGFHYYVQKNYDCSKTAWTKLKELDPTNEKAITALADKNVAAGKACTLIMVIDTEDKN